MTTNDKLVELGLLTCETCIREVSKDQAENPETADYIVHLCGLECYEQWISQDVKSE